MIFRKFFNMGSNQKILSKPIIRPIHISKPSEILSNTDPEIARTNSAESDFKPILDV